LDEEGYVLISLRRTLAGADKLQSCPLVPKTKESCRVAENAWNSRDPKKVSMAYSVDSRWRNRDQFIEGRDAIREFLTDKWNNQELEYRLTKQLWTFAGNRIAVRFQYEYRNAEGQWFRA
jgi:nuclear transport factor 2 (NTF2) superfamily protein